MREGGQDRNPYVQRPGSAKTSQDPWSRAIVLGEAMTSPILVTGGTGTLGRLVVRRLRDAGCDLRVLTRHSDAAKDGIEFMTGELTTGQGIAPAVDGVETIVHLAGSAKGDEDKARNLVQAASSQ